MKLHRIGLACLALLFSGCDQGATGKAVVNEISPAAAIADPYAPRAVVQVATPDWMKDAVLYQLNTRQFTPEGTFSAARAELPRLAEMGVDVIWLMPIHPIGEKNRKGSLGSPYSVRDFYGVNPEFGSKDDLRALIEEAHRLGMKVILDWVANHSAWDNPLVESHPHWYERDPAGNFLPTLWWDWSDIIDFNYSSRDLREYMTEALVYWVAEFDIDGYRADVAAYVPIDFWVQARKEMEAIKPVFLLAEAEMRDLHYQAFDATYAWGWNEAMHNIAVNDADVSALFGYYSEQASAWPRGAMRMTYTANHDQNSWHGTQFERFGDALQPAIVLSFVNDGLPLIYNGQEAGNEKRLEFFERDPIEWRDHPLEGLFARLIALKTQTPALWNGKWGAPMVPVVNSAPKEVLSFTRLFDDGSGVLALFNFSAEEMSVTVSSPWARGEFTDAFTGEEISIGEDSQITIAAWGWRVLTR
jgi:1,4-alpha-glucan branching enzyme